MGLDDKRLTSLDLYQIWQKKTTETPEDKIVKAVSDLIALLVQSPLGKEKDNPKLHEELRKAYYGVTKPEE